MRHLTFTIFFIFLSIQLISQNKDFWVEAPSPYNSNLEIYGLLSNGGIVAKTNNPDKTLYSIDDGATWQELSSEIPFSRNNEYTIKSFNDKLYFGNRFGFYEIDIATGEYTEILGIEGGNDDFIILPDGRKLILGAEGDLIFLDNQNSEINRISLGTTLPFGRILYQDGYPIYLIYFIGGDRVIQSISSDFQTLGTAIVVPRILPNPSLVRVSNRYPFDYQDGIVYRPDSYSSDGGATWISYNLPNHPLLEFGVIDNSVLYFLGSDQAFVSLDRGNSFTSLPLGFSLEDEEFYVYESGASILVTLETCTQNRALITENGGLSWTEIDTDIGQPVTYEISSGLNGNVFVSTCSEGVVFDQYRLTENGPWEEPSVSNMGNLITLPSGTVIGTTLREYCRSTDHGKNWTCLPYNSTNIRSVLQYRGNKLYLYGYGNEVWVSDDDGLTFTKYPVTLTNLSEVEFLPSGKMIATPFGENTIIEYNIFDQTQTILDEYEGLLINLETLSTDDVVYVFGFTDSNRDQVSLTKYENGTKTLVPLNLPLKSKHIYQLEVDQQNQLFIYGAFSDRVAQLEKENVAFFSNDRGASWIDISPILPQEFSINDLHSGIDSYVYLALEGKGPLKSCCPLSPLSSFQACADQIDFDGDGYGLASDCDDRNANVNPGIAEIPYNGLDDDCNPMTYDDDLDQDGYLMADDCDDSNASVNPGAAEIPNNGIDENCDGIDGIALIDADGDGYFSDEDCDDNNASINPGATEICNFIDDNCDGVVDENIVVPTFYLDQDGDGFGNPMIELIDCTSPVGFVTDNTDCDDTNPNIYPGATEILNNGIDEDCDGTDLVSVWTDTDGDGYLSNVDCDDDNPEINPGATEICNGIDDNCDGAIDENFTLITYYVDADGDLFGDPASSVTDCIEPNGYVTDNTDCDDTNPEINPSSTDIPNNGIDEDCDGMDATTIVDTDGDGYNNDVDCDDNNPAVNPGATEICNDIDDNCDGFIDENQVENSYYLDMDGDGFGNPDASVLDCNLPTGYVIDNSDCDDSNPNINPFAMDEPNNGIDEDCDGMDFMSSTLELSSVSVNLFPNPFLENINVTLSEEIDFQFSLFNLQGQLVHRSTNKKIVYLENVSSGTFLAEIIDMKNGNQYFQKMVKL